MSAAPPVFVQQKSSITPTEAAAAIAGLIVEVDELRKAVRRFRFLAVIVLVAVVASGGLTAWMALRDPFAMFGPSLSAYDVSTPSAALRTSWEVQRDSNLRAGLEIDRITTGRRMQEKLDTLAIEKEAESGGKKLLFVKFQEGGIQKFAVEALEKDAETGIWTKQYFSEYSLEDGPLKSAIQRWNASGAK